MDVSTSSHGIPGDGGISILPTPVPFTTDSLHNPASVLTPRICANLRHPIPDGRSGRIGNAAEYAVNVGEVEECV